MANTDKIIIKGFLVTPGRPVGAGWLEIREDVINRVGRSNDLPPAGDKVFDFGENLVCPGFIDLHVHGGNGYDVMDCSAAALDAIARFHARGGTTAFLGATMSMGRARLKEALAVAVEYRRRQNPAGAALLGIHLEGPYLNPRKKGAQALDELRLPNAGELQEMLDKTGDLVKMVTLAPELPGCPELIAFLARRQVRVAIGHSVAGGDELADAVRAGLAHGTHMFNAMGEFRHRNPGTAGYLLQMPEISVDVIADGLHVHPVAIKLLLKLKGIEKTALITDAIRAAGLPDGSYELGGQKVRVSAGEARLADGALAGSTLTLNRAVAYMVREVGVAIEEAVAMASLSPAVVLGLAGLYGRLESGMKGNVTVMDRDFNVVATFVEGKKAV